MGAKIPADVILASGTLGGSAESDYYAVLVTGNKKHETRPMSWALSMVFENGFNYNNEWTNWPFDAAGNIVPGFVNEQGQFLDKKAQTRYSGMCAAVNTVRKSCQVTDEEVTAAGVFDIDMLNGRTGYVEWHAREDLNEDFGKIARWISKDEYEMHRAKGERPRVKAKEKEEATADAGGSATGAAPTGGALPTRPTADNGATATKPSTPRIPAPPRPGQGA